MVVCRSLIVLLSYFSLWPLFCILSSIYGLCLFFGTVWLPLWYLLVTSLVSSDHPLVPSVYPCGTLCLPLWYLLVVPLVPSSYNLWCLLITLWYHLITSLVHSRYHFVPFGIPPFLSFCLPFCYLLVATLVPSDCPFLWYHLPIHCYLLITSFVHSDYLFGTFWLPPLLPSAYPSVTFLWLP